MIGITAHSEKFGAGEITLAILEAFEARGAKCLMDQETALLAGRQSDLTVADLARLCELLVVLGGDGTILRVVHRLSQVALIPIFGINIGSLGFLTCLGREEYCEAVDSILKRNFILSRRTLLQVHLKRLASEYQFLALNDVVVSRGERSRLVRMRVSIDSEELTQYNADGLILSTPTGSTAYSLSSGGPILLPGSGAFVLTPICPHVLTNRSVVISDKSVVTVALAEKGQDVFVNVDGQDVEKMSEGDQLVLRKSEKTLELAMLPGRSFSTILRQKLKWTGSNV